MDATGLESLLRAALAGDQTAYRRFLAELAPVLRGMALANLPAGRRDLAEDVVQEVLLIVHTKRASWDPARPLMAWLRVILRHKLIDLLRRGPKGVQVPVEDHAETLAAPEHDPLAARQVDQLLSRLSPRDAALIRGHALEGADAAELCAEHGLSAGGLRVALHRALSRLADLARKEGNE